MASTRRRRTATRSFRPQTDWAAVTSYGSLTADGVTGLDSDVANLSAIEGDAPLNPLGESYTLMRTRGLWHAYPVTWPNSSPGIVDVAIGIGVAPSQAITAAAVPNPIEDAEWDGWIIRKWTYWRLPTFVTGTGAASSLGNTTATGSQWDLESRAMRRLEDNDLFMCITVGTDTGEAVVVNYVMDFRQLFQQSAKR